MFSFSKNKEVRANPAGFVIVQEGQTFNNSNSIKAFYEEGYKQNVIAFKCIREIAFAIAGIQLELWQKGKNSEGDKPIEKHPILDILNRPNPIQSGKLFKREMVTNYLFAGNAYVLKDTEMGKPAKELWNIPSDKVSVKAGRNGIASQYEIDGRLKYPVDQITGESKLLHIKDVNPKSELIGLSMFEPAAISADMHNAAMKWNYNLIKNGAKPPFAIVGKDGMQLTKEQKSAITEWYNRSYQGEANAGKPIVLSGMEIKTLGLSPNDMDFNTSIREAANYICLAFGVPPVLITGEGNTYNNMKEARESFYENTVLPLLDEILAEFNRWFVKPFGENLYLKYNADAISALEEKRQRKYQRMVEAKNSGIITIDEARAELGFEPIGGLADTLFVGANTIPIEDAGINDMSLEDQSSYQPNETEDEEAD